MPPSHCHRYTGRYSLRPSMSVFSVLLLQTHSLVSQHDTGQRADAEDSSFSETSLHAVEVLLTKQSASPSRFFGMMAVGCRRNYVKYATAAFPVFQVVVLVAMSRPYLRPPKRRFDDPSRVPRKRERNQVLPESFLPWPPDILLTKQAVSFRLPGSSDWMLARNVA